VREQPPRTVPELLPLGHWFQVLAGENVRPPNPFSGASFRDSLFQHRWVSEIAPPHCDVRMRRRWNGESRRVSAPSTNRTKNEHILGVLEFSVTLSSLMAIRMAIRFQSFPRQTLDGCGFLFSVRSSFFRHDISSVGRWPNKKNFRGENALSCRPDYSSPTCRSLPRRFKTSCVAWNVLQKLRLVLSEAGNVAIPPPVTTTRRLNSIFRSGY
jgi:hypothetical protein